MGAGEFSTMARKLADATGIAVEDAFAIVLSVADTDNAADLARQIVRRLLDTPGDVWDVINDVIHG